MKVQATETGYYGSNLRRSGDVFDVPAGETALWFIPLDPPAAPPENSPPDSDPLGIHELTDIPPEEPQSETSEETPPEPQPETDNKPRKPNKQENLK